MEGLDFSILSGNKKVQIAVQRTGQELFHGSKDTGGELVVFMKLTHSDASDASVSVEISEKYLVRNGLCKIFRFTAGRCFYEFFRLFRKCESFPAFIILPTFLSDSNSQRVVLSHLISKKKRYTKDHEVLAGRIL